MRMLDLFCGAGGAGEGYYRAGFDVWGVDINDQPNNPHNFLRGDCLQVLDNVRWLRTFDVIHASPPCQAYSTQTADKSKHTEMIDVVRERLQASGVPYVIENVEGAGKHMVKPVRLCGSSFGLDVRRHRLFESSLPLAAPPCNHGWQTPRFRSLNIAQHRAGVLASVVGVHGHLNYPGEQPIREQAMGIDWMSVKELAQSIPPAYTEFLGRQIMAALKAQRAAN